MKPWSRFRDELVLSASLESLTIDGGSISSQAAGETMEKENVETPTNQPISSAATSKKYECHLCTSVYQKYGFLKNHLVSKHNLSVPDLLKCTRGKCTKSFGTVKKLNRHLKDCTGENV